MLEELITRLLKDHLIDYLDNFDKNSLNISFLKGQVSLQNLQLNNKVLDNIPFPLKMKYGRIGKILIELPSVWQLTTNAAFKVQVYVSDVFMCLATRPMDEWKETTIVDEFHESRQKTLDTYEEDAKFFYIEQKGDDEQMNKFVLQIIQNLHITVERVYIRIEDPYPFALGILIPSITVRTADNAWQVVQQVKKPEIAFKIVRIEDLSIFMERDKDEVSIDHIIGLQDIKDSEDFIKLREKRIYDHIRSIFSGVNPNGSEERKDEILNNMRSDFAREIDPYDFILKKLTVDVRLQMTIDKVRVQQDSSERNEPDMKVSVLCGGLFDSPHETPQRQLRIQLREDQINAVTQFLSVTGVFNSYRLGVLKSYYERQFDPDSEEIQEYIRNYERYQQLKIDKKEEQMEIVKQDLRVTERLYRTDIVYMLRRAINERFYGRKKAEKFKSDALDELDPSRRKQGDDTGFLSNFKFKKTNVVAKGILRDGPQSTGKVRQINFATAIQRMFYNSRFKLHMEEIELLSKDKYDPGESILPAQDNSTMQVNFTLPKLTLQLYSSKRIMKSANERSDNVLEGNNPLLLVHLVMEQLALSMYSESKPSYMKMLVSLRNFYIRDYNTPQPALPYVIQTIISPTKDPTNYNSQMKSKPAEMGAQEDSGTRFIQPSANINKEVLNVFEIEFEINPKQEGAIGNQRLKFYTYGQLYIYANLEFAKRMVQFTQRVLEVQSKNYNSMVDKSPSRIHKEISKGSFYQEMLTKMIQSKQEQVSNNLANYAQGKYEPPKLDLDIYFLSPKIVVHESLLSSRIVNPDEMTSIVIDLGKIEISTQLVPRERGADYREYLDPLKLYDTMTVKFGQLKISADYNLRLSTQILSDKKLSWSFSPYRVDITNDINFGLQLKTCMTPFHPVFPSQIINVKFEQIVLSVSRTVIKSCLKLAAIYQYGDFASALDDFLKQGNQPSQRSELGGDESERSHHPDNNESHDVTNIPLERFAQQVQQEIQQENNKEPLPSLKIEVNVILSKLMLQLQELKLPTFHNGAAVKQSRIAVPSLLMPQLNQGASMRSNGSTQFYSAHSDLVDKKNFLEIGLSGLKTKIQLVPNESTRCELFLRSLFIQNRQSPSNFKHLIHNPFQEDDEDVAAPKVSYHASVSKKSQLYLGQQQTHRVDLNRCRGAPSQRIDHVGIDFGVFKYFNPEQELLSMNNQLSLVYSQIIDDQYVNIVMQSLRVYFLVPDLKKAMRLYVDFTLDQKHVPDHVKQSLKDLPINIQLISPNNQTQPKIQFPKDLKRESVHIQQEGKAPLNSKKTFTLNKQSTINDRNQPKHGRGANLASAIKNAKIKEDQGKEENEALRKQQLIRYGVSEERKVAKMHVTLQLSGLEILMPSSLYEMQSNALKIGTKCEVKFYSLSEYKELRALDKDKTLIESILKREQSEINVKVGQLEIYMEEQSFSDLRASFMPTRLYFLKPYDLTVDMVSSKYYRSKMNTNAKSAISIQGVNAFELQLGLKEIGTYLLLGQVFFQFMNDLTLMQSEVDRTAKKKVDDAIKRRAEKFDRAVNGPHKKQATEAQNDQSAEANDRSQTLDEILIAEGLIKFDVKKTKQLWQRGLDKVRLLVQQRHFSESQIYVDMKGIHFSIMDNSDNVHSQVALISIAIRDLVVKMKSCQFEGMKQELMEHWFQLDDVKKDYQNIKVYLDLRGSYYNRNSFADESFIERFPLRVFIRQESPSRDVKQMVISDQLLNMNLSYGLFCNIQRALVSLLKIEEMDLDAGDDDQIGTAQAEAAEDDKRQEYRKKQISNCLRNPGIVGELDPERHIVIDRGSEPASSDMEFSQRDVSDLSDEESVAFNEVTDIQFINKTGEEVRFCLSNLELDLNSKVQMEINGSNNNNKRIVVLPQSESEIVPMHTLELLLAECRDTIFRKRRNLIKIDFAVKGYRQIKNLVLQRNGVFGYYLHSQTNSKRSQGELSDMSCVVRIQRRDQFIQVYFESGMVMMNDSKHNINLLVIEASKPIQTQHRITINSDQVFNAPLSWFTNHAQIYCQFQSSQEVNTLIFKDLAEVCDPRIVKPYTDHSKVIKVTKSQYVSADIYYLKTKTFVGQFLIAFHPIMTISNLLFTDLTINPCPIDPASEKRVIKTNTVMYMYEINPYDTHNELGANRFQISYKESEYQVYSNSEVSLNLKKLDENVVVGYQEGLFVDLKLEDQRDADAQHVIYIVFEKQQEARPLKNTDYNEFGLRQKYYSRTKCLTFQVYFPYIAINKTPLEMKISSTFLNKSIKPFSSVFIRPIASKLQVEVDNYHKSKYFDINTYLVSGVVSLKKKKLGKPGPGTIMDPALDSENQNILELGTYIGLCPHPYSKTKFIKFLPRYIISNQLDFPIVIKEKNSTHQIALTPGEEIYFNDGQDEEDQLMFRVLNIGLETAPTFNNALLPVVSTVEQRGIDINNIHSTRNSRVSQGGEDLVFNTRPQFASSVTHRREVLVSVEERKDDDLAAGAERSIDLYKPFGEERFRGLWSYSFGLSKVDDFHLTVTNPNGILPSDNGWQTQKDKLFVRVNISPGKDNEATLFISFTKPYYPEYVFYNQTPNHIKVQHFTSKYDKNDIYEMKPKSREVIILNPRTKDEDYLLVEIMDQTKTVVLHKFKYEIDSLKLLFPDERATLFKIKTKMSGNLRFIHLMTQQAREESRQKKINSGKMEEGDPSETESDDDEADIIEEAFEGLDVPNVETDSDQSSYETSESEEEDDIRVVDGRDGMHLAQVQSSEKDKRIQQIAAQHLHNRHNKVFNGEKQQVLQFINLKGLGISLVNSDPKEIIYLSLYEVQLLSFTVKTITSSISGRNMSKRQGLRGRTGRLISGS